MGAFNPDGIVVARIGAAFADVACATALACVTAPTVLDDDLRQSLPARLRAGRKNAPLHSVTIYPTAGGGSRTRDDGKASSITFVSGTHGR